MAVRGGWKLYKCLTNWFTLPCKISTYDFDQSLLNDFDHHQSVYTCIINIRRCNLLFNIVGSFENEHTFCQTKRFVTV